MGSHLCCLLRVVAQRNGPSKVKNDQSISLLLKLREVSRGLALSTGSDGTVCLALPRCLVRTSPTDLLPGLQDYCGNAIAHQRRLVAVLVKVT